MPSSSTDLKSKRGDGYGGCNVWDCEEKKVGVRYQKYKDINDI